MPDDPYVPNMRAPVEADFASAVTLIQLCEEVDEGEVESSEGDIRSMWTAPGFDLSRDAWLMEADGRIVAYGHGMLRDGGRRFEAFGTVHPDYRRRGLGRRVLEAIEQRARDLQARTAGAITIHTNEDAIALLEKQGFQPVRYYWQMRIDLADPPPPPRWPQGVRVRTVRPGEDDRAVHKLVQDAFAENTGHVASPFEEWRHFMVEADNFDPALWFVAEAGGEIAGVALCPNYRDHGWLRQLAVRRDWRRRGLAVALLHHAFAELRNRGMPHVGLAVDSYNRTGAKAVYERAGMRVYRQYDGYDKALR